MESVILEEDIDENYEPTDAEIEEYAQWLGMISPDDDDLRWIAREGLKAPLPEHWKPCKTSDGEVYYFNFSTGESVWDHPCDEHYRKVRPPARPSRAHRAHRPPAFRRGHPSARLRVAASCGAHANEAIPLAWLALALTLIDTAVACDARPDV